MSTDQNEPGPTQPIQATQPAAAIAPMAPTVPGPSADPPIQVAAAPLAPARPELRVGTVVWGLVLAVIGAGVIAVAAGARFDPQLATITVLTLAGVGLLAGSIVTSARRRNR